MGLGVPAGIAWSETVVNAVSFKHKTGAWAKWDGTPDSFNHSVVRDDW